MVVRDRYQGFSLQSVCWGYREIFAREIDGLFRDGLLGSGRRAVTDTFFDMLKTAGLGMSDHVLKEFVCALNAKTLWLLELPAVFSDVTEMGHRFADAKPYYGIGYFKTLGAGGFGRTPEEVRTLMTHLRRLSQVDWDLAFAFLQGYEHLVERLRPEEIRLYVAQGLKIHGNRASTGCGFMRCELKSSETVILSLTRESRLEEMRMPLSRLLKALVGYEVEVSDLGKLDSDELLERGSNMVCMYRWLYLPVCVRYFDRAAQNRDWYVLMGVVAAGMLAQNSWPRIHGAPGYERCTDLVGTERGRVNLFQILEYVRVLRTLVRRWPGAARLVDWAIRTEFALRPAQSVADALLRDAWQSAGDGPAASVRAVADASVNVFDTAANLSEQGASQILEACGGLADGPLRAFGFLPDFLYPGTVSEPPPGSMIADLKEAAQSRRETGESYADGKRQREQRHGGAGEIDEQQEGDRTKDGMDAGYVYDEWDHNEGDYHRHWCIVHEHGSEERAAAGAGLPEGVLEEAQRIRRIFERFRPDLVRREKYLADGDVINVDGLVRYLVQRRIEPQPRVDFYEKPRVNRRDLAVLLLLDVSGSTGAETGKEKVVEIEKRAALILAQGLASLGDRFAICGFSGNGRKNCEYYVFKDFVERWGAPGIARVLAAHPLSSTRIGPALRHAGYRLGLLEAKQRLIILITDGQPMDAEYDPKTRYAQYDVRMACEENRKREIHTFCISTEENSRADMEIMFPARRFVILNDMSQLPRVLPSLYLRMTT